MKLIVGLGNPGKEYVDTRHNSGFNVLDILASKFEMDINENKFKGVFAKKKVKGEDIILFKPLTFMNSSGEAVREITNFYKINVEDIIVVFDDMSILPGSIRLRQGGSSGGQKGMQNIIDNLSTDKIKRVKVGIGEPKHNGVEHVLGKPQGEEKEEWLKGINKASDAIIEFLNSTFDKAMSLYN